jgi:hypothetical protein
MNNARPERRRTKLIRPSLQLKLIAAFLGLSVLCMLLQTLLFGMQLSRAAHELPDSGRDLVVKLPEMLLETLTFCLFLFVPVATAVGVLITFRVAGPIHRFETYLRRVASGEEKGPCTLRKGDDLQELCGLINRATEPVRNGSLSKSESDESLARVG